MKLLGLAAFLALASAPLAIQAKAEAAPQIEDRAASDSDPGAPTTLASGVVFWPSVIFDRPQGFRALELDLYLPSRSRAGPAGGYPLVIYIHGGGWMAGDRRKAAPFADFPSVLATLAERGYAVASVEYRLSAEAKFPAQIEDVKAAIAWLQVHASDYGIDPSRSVAWGVSAGAHLAALAAVTCDSATRDSGASGRAPAVGQRDCVQAVVGWYGLYDFSTVAEQARLGSDISRGTADAPEWRLLGCVAEACGTRLQAASPVAHVTSHSPPMLLIVGDGDRLIPHQQTLEMAQRLSAAGVPHKLVVIPGADHSFRGKTLGQTREANLTALDDTLRFLDQMFSRGAAAPAPP